MESPYTAGVQISKVRADAVTEKTTELTAVSMSREKKCLKPSTVKPKGMEESIGHLEKKANIVIDTKGKMISNKNSASNTLLKTR